MKYLNIAMASVLALSLAACGGENAPAAEAQKVAPEVAKVDVMAKVLAAPMRSEAAARDVFRHPAETLEFFGLEAGMTVVEIWPGGGWYADVIAPYLASGGGTYYAAGFDPEGASERTLARIESFKEKYSGNSDVYGDVKVTAFSAKSGPVAPADSADMVLTFRNVHNWMRGEFTDKAFADFYTALKPGGILGVVEHRMPTTMEQDAAGTSGYVREDYVITMAEAAGFEFVDSSEINANAADTADHPFGVWTLPPSSRQPREADDTFDPEKYKAIGESDRMTLKFRKPITADGAMLE